MKIIRIGEPRVIMSNPESHHDYFGWPTAVRLKNNKIAVVASGFRLRHVCPFGKTVISYSEDEGETYTLPAPVIDTVLDDRDGGIMTFGERGVIVTSFNNTVNFQREQIPSTSSITRHMREVNNKSSYDLAYLDTISEEEEEAALGASFRMSFDHGVTFGERFKSPITSPHGPIELPDGTILWVGRTFSAENKHRVNVDRIEAHRVNLDGSMEFLGAVEDIVDNGEIALSCEPHAIPLDDGSILAHIRVQSKTEDPLFTIYQSRSTDGGKTWSKPRMLLSRLGGSPPHILKTSTGLLVCTYGHRKEPYGIRAMISSDGGESWETDLDICAVSAPTGDLGYPSTVELSDGSFITVYYAHQKLGDSALIMQQRWRIEE